jgi:hypothetical protein
MTTVLLKSMSESTWDERIYEDNETATNPPDLESIIAREFGYQRPTQITIDDKGGTTLGTPDADVHAVVRKALQSSRNVVIMLYGRPQEDGLTLHCPFTREEATSTEVNFGQSAGESTSPGDVEEVPQTLREALDAISEVRYVAIEEDCDEPSDVAIANAKAVLRAMHDLSSRAYDIYPMSGGEIAIDGGSNGRRIGVFCYPDGRIQYVGWVDGERQEIRRTDDADIPTDFLRRALGQLEL